MSIDIFRGKTALTHDLRPIQAVWFFGEGAGGYQVGKARVTQIIAYDENGERDLVPWVAVLVGDKISVRIPASQVSVHYMLPDENENF